MPWRVGGLVVCLTLTVLMAMAAGDAWAAFTADPAAEVLLSGRGGTDRHHGPAWQGAVTATVTAALTFVAATVFAWSLLPTGKRSVA